MSQSVDRLKELLFDSETQAMADLARRIDSVAESDYRAREELKQRIEQDFVQKVEIESRAREELKQKVAQVFDRVGTAERFTANVASVLDSALRQAEINSHSELADAMAPIVVSTIKAELKNSQDEMVEALYPITGRLVSAYVASAIKDLTAQINRRLEQNAFMLRLQSLTTGRSVAELAMAGGGDFKVEELYLIRRGSGELAAHWPDRGPGGREQLMSGVLAAVNEFANEAFAADQSALRQIDLGNAKVYLRGSPLYLLAAKCTGTADKAIEQTMDEAFLAAVEMQHEITSHPVDARTAAKEQASLLSELGAHLENKIAEQNANLPAPVRGGPLKAIAAIILLPLVGWFGWNWYTAHERAHVEEAAIRVIAATSAMQGYPTKLQTSPLGRVLTVQGLAPSQEIKAKVVDRLTKVLTGTEIRDQLAVVPGGNAVPINIPEPNPHLAEEITGQVTGKVAGQVAGQVAQVTQVAEEMGKQNAELKRTVTSLEAQINLSGTRRSVDRADRRLRQALADLDKTAKATEEPERVIAIKRIMQGIEIAARDLATQRNVVNTEADAAKAAAPLAEIATRIEGLSGDIAKYVSGETLQSVPAKKGGKSEAPAAASVALDAAAESVAAEAERLSAMASTVALTNNLKPHAIAAAPASDVGPRERLEAFARSHAVFFGNAGEYRSPDMADKTLKEIAPLIKDAAIIVRVVGYTDEVGAQARNTTVALERAKTVRQDLIQRGVPENLLAVAGRTKVADLSPTPGPASPNRRVEFELSFVGEAQQ
jgi:outer membrane protein OmpA-like peptidoglycan-associated protein